MTEDPTPSHCPKCRSDRVLEIVYGMPEPELEAQAMRGELELGGCCVGPDGLPTLSEQMVRPTP